MVEQFLGVAQIGIQKAVTDSWTRPGLLPIALLAGRAAKLGDLATKLSGMSSNELRANAAQFNVMLDERRVIKRMSRNLGVGTWPVTCEIASTLKSA